MKKVIINIKNIIINIINIIFGSGILVRSNDLGPGVTIKPVMLDLTLQLDSRLLDLTFYIKI